MNLVVSGSRRRHAASAFTRVFALQLCSVSCNSGSVVLRVSGAQIAVCMVVKLPSTIGVNESVRASSISSRLAVCVDIR